MRVFVLVWLFLAGCASKPTHGTDQDVFPVAKTVTIGTIDILDLGKATASDVFVGDKSVAEVEPGNNPHEARVKFLRMASVYLVIKGEPGSGNQHILYTVISDSLNSQLSTVSRLLEGIPGIKVGILGNVVRISGELTRPETVVRDYDRIFEAERLFICLNTVTIADSLYEAAAEQMQREIEKIDGASKVKVRVLNGTFVLEGETASAAARDRAESFVQLLLPPIKSSPAFQESALLLGAKKFSIRNLIQLKERSPASACPKN